MANSDLLKIAVMWYGAGILPRLRAMDREGLQRLTNKASQLSQECPLHLIHAPEFEILELDSEKLTGGQVIAVMVFGLYVLCGENDKMAGALLESWPEIKMAKALVDGPKKPKKRKGGKK